jgi:hypothetical protein
MKVSVTAKVIYDDKFGKLKKGQSVDLPEHKANFYLERGEVEFYQTKVLRDRPYQAAGEQSSALQVAQALPAQTLSELGSGEKKRGRKPKALLSATQVSE